MHRARRPLIPRPSVAGALEEKLGNVYQPPRNQLVVQPRGAGGPDRATYEDWCSVAWQPGASVPIPAASHRTHAAASAEAPGSAVRSLRAAAVTIGASAMDDASVCSGPRRPHSSTRPRPHRHPALPVLPQRR